MSHVHAGFADYGVNVNPSKTRLSFDMTTSDGMPLQACVCLPTLCPHTKQRPHHPYNACLVVISFQHTCC